MFSTSDINKILEALPLLQNLADVIDRVAELEDRATAIESHILKIERADCPKCAGEVLMSHEKSDPLFPGSSAKIRTFLCSACGYREDVSIGQFNEREIGVNI